ncbi:MAG: hypothetical protein HY791_32015 [Deltaproteobacteria bacterium]|nr:hypothetical protein [Deltaproteobacteria bacterium]
MSERTRIAFLTEGLLNQRIEVDPTFEGVGAVIIDEFHERSIHAGTPFGDHVQCTS